MKQDCIFIDGLIDLFRYAVQYKVQGSSWINNRTWGLPTRSSAKPNPTNISSNPYSTYSHHKLGIDNKLHVLWLEILTWSGHCVVFLSKILYSCKCLPTQVYKWFLFINDKWFEIMTWQDHYAVFLGKSLYSYKCISPRGCINDSRNCQGGLIKWWWTNIPSRGEQYI